jgi:hypothetical protein
MSLATLKWVGGHSIIVSAPLFEDGSARPIMELPYFKSFLDLPPFSLSISTTFGHPDFSFRVNRKSRYIDRFHLCLTAPGRALCILFPDTLLKTKAPFWQIKSRPHTLQREDGPKEKLFSAPIFTTEQVGKLVTCLTLPVAM